MNQVGFRPVGLPLFSGRREDVRRLRERAERLEAELRQLREDIVELQGSERTTDSAKPSASGTVKFLSPEWAAAMTKALTGHFQKNGPWPTAPLDMNIYVMDGPNLKQEVFYRLGSKHAEVGIGELNHPHLALTIDYESAKALASDASGQKLMQAFMAGRIRIQGDMSRLMALQAQGPSRGFSLFDSKVLGDLKVEYD